MSRVDEALKELDVRMRNSASAQHITKAAREDAHVAEVELEGARLEVEAERKETEKAHGVAKQWEETANELRSALEASQLEVAGLKEPRRQTTVKGQAIEYRYHPSTRVDNTYADPIWRLDEIESALMHLRMAGGSDASQVIIRGEGSLASSVKDDGQLVDGWKNEHAKAKPRKVVKVKKIAMPPGGTIAVAAASSMVSFWLGMVVGL